MLLNPLHSAGGDNHEEAYNQVYDDNNPPYDDDNKAKFSHEAVGGELRLFNRLCAALHLVLAFVACNVAQRVTFAEVDFASAGAAAFFAMREYEKHQAANGQPPSHQFAKEMMAGVAGAEVSFCYHHILLLQTELQLIGHLCCYSCSVLQQLFPACLAMSFSMGAWYY